MRQLFAINALAGGGGAIPVGSFTEAESMNEKGWDIYWAVNIFNPPSVRRISNLKTICSIAFEIDATGIENFKKQIYPTPSLIIKTKNGFHVYYDLEDPIDCTGREKEMGEWYRNFLENRIVDYFNADPSCKDAARIFRVPMMRYWKDKMGKTIIEIVSETNKKYSINELEIAFPITKKEVFELPKEIKARDGNSFWDIANSLPVKECLQKLSGSGYVSGETYKFKKEKDTVRIYIDGVRRNAWIDRDGKIGSQRGLGPSITNWLYYHNRDWKKVADILKKEFNL